MFVVVSPMSSQLFHWLVLPCLLYQPLQVPCWFACRKATPHDASGVVGDLASPGVHGLRLVLGLEPGCLTR